MCGGSGGVFTVGVGKYVSWHDAMPALQFLFFICVFKQSYQLMGVMELMVLTEVASWNRHFMAVIHQKRNTNGD